MRTKEEYRDELHRRIESCRLEGAPLSFYAEAIMEEFIGLSSEALAEMRADLMRPDLDPKTDPPQFLGPS